MENATKALLIAAAVLVVILIISLGIGIFTMANEQIEGAGDLSEYQIQQFNEKFTKYEGEKVSGSDVNALIKAAFNHNQVQEDEYTMVEVKMGTETIVGKGDAFVATSTPDKVSTAGIKYKVECTLDSNSKLVTSITITDLTETPTPDPEG